MLKLKPSILALSLLLICGCGTVTAPKTPSDRIFTLENPDKTSLRQASSEFVANIAKDCTGMYPCAEKFLLTDDYQSAIYRKHIRSRKKADILYFLYKNDLAIRLASTDDSRYHQLLFRYYFPGGISGMTDADMVSAEIRRLTYRGTGFYSATTEKLKYASIDIKEKTDLADGRLLAVYSAKWPDEPESTVFNTIFMRRPVDGRKILLPVQHNIIGSEEY